MLNHLAVHLGRRLFHSTVINKVTETHNRATGVAAVQLVLYTVSNKCIVVRKVATPLRELTCHMGSHSVTCHPAEVTFPPLPEPKLVLD